MEKDACYKIGYITRPHGLKGEVTAILTEPIDLSDISSFFIEYKNSLVPFFIESFSDRGDKTFFKFEEIDSTEKADPLKGCNIFLPKAIRPKLKRGEFYDDEVVGFKVEDKTKGLLGTVTEVSANGPNRLITLVHNQKEVLIPVHGPFITSTNKSKKLIVVDLPEGFLDI
ncbi:MAG: ribosome maturation factor RimM [Flammeovirgaceae bacterium]